MAGNSTRKISAASARAHTRKHKISSNRSFNLFSNVILQITLGSLVAFLVYAYIALKPSAARICGSPGGPLVTSPRIKLADGRHLAYKERGSSKEAALHKIIVAHGFGDSKDFNLPVSEEFLKESGIYILQFDRAGYGESDPNPARTVKSEAFDIQELADKLHLGSKFYVMGISIGSYPTYSCLYYIPHRLAGAALVSPFTNFWWRFFPMSLAKQEFERLLVQDQWTFRIAHYTPWLVNWWLTQKWLPSLSIMQGKLHSFGPSDFEMLQKLSETPKEGPDKATQQGVHESLHRDMMTALGRWGFEPTDISNPFPNGEGSVHLWHGYEDGYIPYALNRYIVEKLPWIQYHEIRDAGHLLIYNATYCEDVLKTLTSS